MIYLPDTNTCISLLRQKQPHLIARWRSTKVTDITLCSIVVYELRHGAESSSDPAREHAKLDVFLAPFSSLPFDDACEAAMQLQFREHVSAGSSRFAKESPRNEPVCCVSFGTR
jgi:predicted nucleic acid-binding protein